MTVRLHQSDGQGTLEALDPRVARSRAAILRATADLLIEAGAAGVTIEGVAERSGVAKTTIYRHWESRSRLVVDAFESLLDPGPIREFTGPVRDRLVAMLTQLVAGLTTSGWAPAVTALVDAADRDAELRQLLLEFLTVRFQAGRAALKAAVADGELGAGMDIDAAFSLLVGPIFYRRLVSREPLDERFIAEIVDLFVRGAATAKGS